MSNELIARLKEPNDFVNAVFLIGKTEREGVYITKNVYLDDDGKPESSSIGWSEVGIDQLRHILSIHFELPQSKIDSILSL